MRLLHIAQGCESMIDIWPSIKAVYQMEAEFSPYLTIEFLPYREGQIPGIILQTKDGDIRKNYTFKNKTDIKELRDLIWKYIVPEKHIKDITKNGCLTDFKEYGTSNVIQGWKAKKRALDKEKCCQLVLDSLVKDVVGNNILHEVYRLSPIDRQDKNICKKVRFEACGNNFPKGSAVFKRCVQETEWLCNHGYPNVTVNKMNDFVNKVRKNLWRYLRDNDLRVNKRKFDEIISAGLFDDLGNRMGNKVADDKNVRASLDQIFTEKDYYLGLIEGFDDEDNDFRGAFYEMGITLIVIMFLLYIAYGFIKS
jgi:hypothetical protein